MSKVEKLTLADIIKNKEQIVEGRKKTADIEVPSLNGYIVVERPTRDLLADAQEIKNGIESNIHLVYNCVISPDLKDKDTQKAFGVETPKELLQVLMTDGEIGEIGTQLMTLAGYGSNGVKLVDDIKN